MTNKTTLIKSNSPLIQPFVVHPDATTLPKEKILEMQQSSEILKESACAILEVNINNLDKMQEDFVIPAGSCVHYQTQFDDFWDNINEWTNPKYSPNRSRSFYDYLHEFICRTITIIVPIEPQQGSDFCFKGDEEHQDFKDAYFSRGFRKPLEVRDGSVYDGSYVANFKRLNLLPFGFETSEVPEEKAEGSISLQDACAEAEDNAIAAQDEANKLSEISEALYQIQIEVNKLKTFDIEVEVKIKK